jgi:hypothetical protein
MKCANETVTIELKNGKLSTQLRVVQARRILVSSRAGEPVAPRSRAERKTEEKEEKEEKENDAETVTM